MKLLTASTAIAVVIAGPAGWAASGANAQAVDNPVASSQAASQKPGLALKANAMINVMPARRIVGRQLKDPDGIDAGKIDSLVIDTKSGLVQFVMISPPSSFNAHGRLIAAPWAALNPPTTNHGTMTTKFKVDKLAKAPRIDPRLIYELNMPEQRDRMYGFYGDNYPGYSGMGYNERIAGAQKNAQFELGSRDRQIALSNQEAAKRHTTNKDQSAIPSALVVAENGVIAKLEALSTTSAAAMHDSDIYDSKGNDIGEFDETMIDVNRGDVAYVLIAHGGFLGMDQNLYVAPIEALSLSPYRASYRLTVNAKVLENEPALHIERGSLPSRVSAAQLATLYQRFGIQPYWKQASQPNVKHGKTKN